MIKGLLLKNFLGKFYQVRQLHSQLCFRTWVMGIQRNIQNVNPVDETAKLKLEGRREILSSKR